MGPFGFGELVVVLLVALIVFKPEQLPDVARQIGTVFRRIREEVTSATRDLEGLSDQSGLRREIRSIRKDLHQTRSALRVLVDGDGPADRMSRITKANSRLPAPHDMDWT